MNNKNMAAIALLLIVSVPLLLGFALNFEQTEKTAWQSTQTVNLSETLLNSATPYYSAYNGPNNNQDLLLMELRSDDTTYTYLNPPGYNSVSENPSTIPYMNSTASGLLQLSPAQGQFRITGGTAYLGTIPDTSNAVLMDAHDIYYITLGMDPTFTLYSPGEDPETVAIAGISYIYTMGPGIYALEIYANDTTTVYENLTGIKVQVNYAGWDILYKDAASINDLIGRKVSWNNPTGYAYLQVTHSNGEMEAYARHDIEQTLNISIDVNSVFITSGQQLTVFNDVVSAKYYSNAHGSGGSISYTVLVQSSLSRLWADPAAGWKIPIGYIAGSEDVNAWWANGYSNNYVRMMLNIPAESQTTLTAGNGNPVLIRNTAGTITVNGEILGDYTNLMVQFSPSAVTVSGIVAWPSMGAMPTAYNTKTVEQSAADFAVIQIEDDMKVSYRVDAAEIASGYYPVTKNYNFNPNEKFPNTSYNIRFNSVAVYGDSITLAGTQYTVTDGRITVNDQIVPLLHSEIRSIYNDETAQYDNTINGVPLASTATPAAIYFGGEWSLIAYYYGMEKVTETANEWKAGGFGLTEQGTIVVALLVDLAAFLVFGFYGRRTGTKVGWLLALCGGAGFVLLCML